MMADTAYIPDVKKCACQTPDACIKRGSCDFGHRLAPSPPPPPPAPPPPPPPAAPPVPTSPPESIASLYRAIEVRALPAHRVRPEAAIERAAQEAAGNGDDAIGGDEIIDGFVVAAPKKAYGDYRFAIKYRVTKHLEIAERVEKMIANDPAAKIFLNGGPPVRIAEITEVFEQEKFGRLGTQVMNEDTIYHEIELNFVFFDLKAITEGKGAAKQVVGYEWKMFPRPPKSIAKTIVEERAGRQEFKPLSGIMRGTSMKLGKDGKPVSIAKPGYDPDTGIFFSFNEKEFPWLSEMRTPPWGGPTPMPLLDTVGLADAQAALGDLKELLEQTAYYDPEDPENVDDTPQLSVGLSKPMTVVLRAAFPHAPIHATSGKSGAGKSASDAVGVILGHGELMAPLSFPARAEKLETIIDSALVSAKPVWMFNNVQQGLAIGNEPDLNTVVTEPRKEVRTFFTQGFKSCSTALVSIFMNGVALQVVGEVSRRTLMTFIRADQPFDAKRDPRVLAKRDRSKYVRAIHVIARAYWNACQVQNAHANGDAWATDFMVKHFGADSARWARVGGLKKFDGFEGWSRLVREPLVWLGMPDPCETSFRLKASNAEANVTAGAFVTLRDRFGEQPFTVADIISAMTLMSNGGEMGGDAFPPTSVRANGELIEAMLALMPRKYGQTLDAYRQSLGMKLSNLSADMAPQGGLIIQRVGLTRNKSAIFKMVAQGTAGTAGT